MKITLIRLGKLHLPFAQAGFDEYSKRLKHYVKFNDELLVVTSKSKEEASIKKLEGEAILKKIQATDYLVLLDERGKSFSSPGFAKFIEQMQLKTNHLVFVIGGAYGFDESVYARANAQLSISEFTFSHQLVPLIFGEQLYRAFTIIKGEPYHHS
ncbi:MAG: 23S rRNA (pseudouridine(1915)-N(3))-methyltransferase RlmH [Bacteroidetes bacterium B1(2017)]|nr:MAG: 23S rRNA (pseudouridine(1915)-N(3))-methyltransferase RlmH [Bacteroidetes bacterium B1(2017)]